jgi:hypothetical protein
MQYFTGYALNSARLSYPYKGKERLKIPSQGDFRAFGPKLAKRANPQAIAQKRGSYLSALRITWTFTWYSPGNVVPP